MWKEIKNSFYSFFALYLLSCFVAFVLTGAIVAGVIFLPIALLWALFLAIKEAVGWKKKAVKGRAEHVFRRKEPAVKVLDESGMGTKEWMNRARVRWTWYWPNDNLTFNH